MSCVRTKHFHWYKSMSRDSLVWFHCRISSRPTGFFLAGDWFLLGWRLIPWLVPCLESNLLLCFRIGEKAGRGTTEERSGKIRRFIIFTTYFTITYHMFHRSFISHIFHSPDLSFSLTLAYYPHYRPMYQ